MGRQLGIPSLGGVVTEFASDGAARIHFRVAPGLHRVPDGIVTAALEAQLMQHIGAAWIACVITDTGHGVIRPSAPGVGTLDKPMQALLTGIAIALNKHEARDGHWVVVLNVAEHEIAAMWRDGDGDCHAVIEFGEPLMVRSWTDTDFGAHAAAALDAVKAQHAKVEASKKQQIRMALGEKPTRH